MSNKTLRRSALCIHASILTCAVLVLASCASITPTPQISPAASSAEAGLVDIRTWVPDIVQDIRYARTENFVGTAIAGYEAPRCYLLQPAAQALQRVELALRTEGFRLKIFDCYRPARAVRHFVEWAGDLSDQKTKAQYYPNIDKQSLLGDYISPASGHSRGATVDLTLMRCDTAGERCTPLDMGTGFDFFDLSAHTDSPAVTPAQRENRHRLRAAMMRAGFQNYPLEWWHYTLRPEPAPDTAYDFPVR